MTPSPGEVELPDPDLRHLALTTSAADLGFEGGMRKLSMAPSWMWARRDPSLFPDRRRERLPVP